MDLNAIRTKTAESDVRAACKYGQVMIGQTSKGTVEVRHQGDGLYRVTVMGSPTKEPEVLQDSGRKSATVAVLAPLYVLVQG